MNTPSASESPPIEDQTQWFVEKVHPHDADLKQYLRSSFPSVPDVEDVVQESYLRVWQRQVLHPLQSARSFLYRVARNLAVDKLRRSAISPLKQLGARTRRRRHRRLAALSVACIGLIAVGTLWRARLAPASQPGAQVAIVAPTRTLPDGSVVELKPGAEISVDYKGATRAIGLSRGEAHFQVAHDPKPFVVSVGAVEFRAVGTAFAVVMEEESVELLVTQGRVAVEKPTPPATSSTRRIAFSTTGRKARRSPCTNPSAPCGCFRSGARFELRCDEEWSRPFFAGAS